MLHESTIIDLARKYDLLEGETKEQSKLIGTLREKVLEFRYRQDALENRITMLTEQIKGDLNIIRLSVERIEKKENEKKWTVKKIADTLKDVILILGIAWAVFEWIRSKGGLGA